MAARANWKGVLRIGNVSCQIALYTAASTAERISFHILNRKTGDRVHRQFIDEKTGKPVPAEHEEGVRNRRRRLHHLRIREDRQSRTKDKTLDVQAFVPCDQVDDVYFDRPYYLAPSTQAGAKPFILIRDALVRANVVSVARTVLFRRVRSVLIRAHGKGLVAHTLNFDYEVRPAADAFSDIRAGNADEEMLDLALHIIHQKAGRFDPTRFDDRYDAALRKLIKARWRAATSSRPKPQSLPGPPI